MCHCSYCAFYMSSFKSLNLPVSFPPFLHPCLPFLSSPLSLCPFFQKSEVPLDYDQHDPEQKQIYRFVRTLFSAAQLTSECAIVTLVRFYYYFCGTCNTTFIPKCTSWPACLIRDKKTNKQTNKKKYSQVSSESFPTKVRYDLPETVPSHTHGLCLGPRGNCTLMC